LFPFNEVKIGDTLTAHRPVFHGCRMAPCAAASACSPVDPVPCRTASGPSTLGQLLAAYAYSPVDPLGRIADFEQLRAADAYMPVNTL
jgi:hypothetical protein